MGVENPKVKPPKKSAAGVPAVMHALEYSLEQTSLVRTAINLLSINQTKGIDCPGCAWPEPEPGKRHKNEYCENGAKHINDEATTRRITREFFREHSVSELAAKKDMWLNEQGRLTEPMVKRPGLGLLRADQLGRRTRPVGGRVARARFARRSAVLHLWHGSATRRRSCCSFSRGRTARTTCRTAATCATNPAVPD